MRVGKGSKWEKNCEKKIENNVRKGCSLVSRLCDPDFVGIDFFLSLFVRFG